MGWQKLLTDSNFVDITIGDPVDTFGGASGEAKARQFDVHGFPFLCRKPS